MLDIILIIAVAGAVIGLAVLYERLKIPIKYIPDAVIEELPPEDEVPDAKETRRDRIKKMKEKQALADILKPVVADDEEYEDIGVETINDIETGNTITKHSSNYYYCCCWAYNHAPIDAESKAIKRVKKVKHVIIDAPVSIDRNAVKNSKRNGRNSVINSDIDVNDETKPDDIIEYIKLSESVSLKDLLTVYYTRFDAEKLKNIDKLIEKYTDKEFALIDALEKKYGKLLKEKENIKKGIKVPIVVVPESPMNDEVMTKQLENEEAVATAESSIKKKKKQKQILYQGRRGAVSEKGKSAESSSGSDEHQNSSDDDDDDAEIHPVKDLPIGSSLFDFDRTERRKETLVWRKSVREKKKMQQLRRGEIDTIALNSGPLPNLIPPGYVQSQNIPIDLMPVNLLKRKILYLWEGNDVKAHGWFIGAICAPSKSEGFNFNIKYDKFVTMNHYVDGIHKVYLSHAGSNAYGRRWVLLDRTDNVVSEAEE